MSLKQAILGLLHYADLSGSDLTKILDHSVQHFWSTEHTQVYRALAGLHAEGLTDVEVVPQADRPEKKVYRLTEAGRRTFAAWLTSSSSLPEVRHSHLLQLSFMDALPLDQILGFLDQYEAQVRERLDHYRSPDQLGRAQSMARTPRERTLWALVLDNGIRAYEAELAWCQNARTTLQGEQDETPS